MKAKKLPSIRLVFPILFFVIGFVSNISSQTTLVSWNFDDEDRVADDGITANLSKTILREDPFSGAYSFYLGAGGGKSLSTMGWTEGADSKYWMIEFSTIGYGSLTLSSKQYSSNQAPRDFKVQYSIDNCSTWTDVPNSSITVGTDFTTGIISELQLPDECNNQASVFLRWIMTSNTAVAESLDLASGSNSRIDDIVIASNMNIGTSIVSWNFEDEDRLADDGITANLSKLILREDSFSGTYSFYTGAGGGKSLSTMGWTDGANSKYWMIEFSTIGYGSLTFSSKQYSSNQAPRDFKVQYSIDNCSTWTDVPNSSITVGTDFTTGIISELQLPDECNNQASVFLRWIMTSNTAVAESLDLASGSNSRIDDIVIYSYSEVVTISSEITEDKLFVSVFPNPNNGSFSINTNIINSKLKIFNMLGEMIDSRILNDQEYYRIDLSSHPKGMYFVKIYSGEYIYTKKIIVQ
jgi:hypothetical protein